MKKNLTFVIALTLNAICFSQDSSFIDLGRTQLRKGFVQAITINGEDLERIPAVSLEEAINVWLYGTLSHSGTLTYAVDGHIIADVNLYSIHDIEEVQLVQNAVTQLNGAFWQQQMVLIKTKKKQLPGNDLRIAGQSALITKKVIDLWSSEVQEGEKNSFFHHYFLSARHQSEKINMGVSLSFLKDVNVMVDSFLTKQSPDNLERFRFNGHFDWNINKQHTLLTKLNLAKQINDRSMEWFYVFTIPPAATNAVESKGNDFILESEASLRSHWSGGWSNVMTVAYSGLEFEQNTTITSDYNPTNPPVRKLTDEIRTKNFLISNSLRWLKQSRSLSMSPALNLHYRYSSELLQRQQTVPSNYHDSYAGTIKNLLATPSIDMAYKNLFNLQLGLLSNLSQNHQQRFYPFASLSTSISDLMKQGGNFDWKIFTSYSKFDLLYDHIYPLREYDDGKEMLQIVNEYPNTAYNPPPDMNHFNWQAGTKLALWNNRINLGYNFEKRTYPGTYQNSYLIYYALTQAQTNDIRIIVQPVKTSAANWLSTMHFTSIKNKAIGTSQPYQYYGTGSDINDRISWSCGWNNRLQHGKLLLGFDLLWQLDKKVWNYQGGTNPVMDYRNLFSLHNAFLGYKMATKKSAGLEIYITARNPVQDKDYLKFVETRTYYGAGFKMML